MSAFGNRRYINEQRLKKTKQRIYKQRIKHLTKHCLVWQNFHFDTSNKAYRGEPKNGNTKFTVLTALIVSNVPIAYRLNGASVVY